MTSRRLNSGVLATLASLCALGSAYAGDPIQFSTDKTKPLPANSRPAEPDMFKSRTKQSAPTISPLDSITPFITPGRIDPKDERRLKNARDEKKNWMLLEPGELQKRDEEEQNKFGGKGVSDAFQTDDDKGNYLFHGVTQSKSDKPKNAPVRQTADGEEETKKENRAPLNVFGVREGEPAQGAHTASELNLKGLIDPSMAPPPSKAEASLYQFFKDNGLAAPSDRNQQMRLDSFRDFINGPQGNTAPSGVSDPINFRTDLTQERLNPIMPSRPAFELPASVKAPDNFSAKPAFGGLAPAARAPGAAGLPDLVNAPRQPMTGPSLPSPFLNNEATKTPRASVMGNNSLFNREAPRRGGL